MIRAKSYKERFLSLLALICTFFGIILLSIFIINILIDGLLRIDSEFLTNLPSRKAEKAGILTAWTGSLWIMVLLLWFLFL